MNDTILAAIITGVFSLIGGFVAGYNYCIKINKKYNQKAAKGSTQIQIGTYNVRK